ncbi:hypothetical protein LCGC14_1811510, partial [marine sediment metagenome]
RETWVDGRTSASSGTAKVSAHRSIGGHAIDGFESVLAYLDVNTKPEGTSPTLDIRLQRAVVPNPDEDTDAHWDTFLAFSQVTDSAAVEKVAIASSMAITFIGSQIDFEENRDAATAERTRPGPWGDVIRVVEAMGGTVTTAAVWSLHITGTLRASD